MSLSKPNNETLTSFALPVITHEVSDVVLYRKLQNERNVLTVCLLSNLVQTEDGSAASNMAVMVYMLTQDFGNTQKGKTGCVTRRGRAAFHA